LVPDGSLVMRRFRRARGSSSPTVPRGVRHGFIRSAFVSSSKFLRHSSRQAPRQSRRSCRVLCPLRDITDCVHVPVIDLGPSLEVRGFPGPRFVPPAGFLDLSAACSAIGCAGLFHPAATSRVLIRRSGVSPDPQRSPSRRRSRPPCRWPTRTDRRPDRRPRAPRLRGFVPRIGACFGCGV